MQDIEQLNIENMIYEIRGKQVMLDSDLAKLYECVNGTKTINLAVKRHIKRFPERFMFQITKEECQKIIDGDIDFMIKSDKPLLQELYAKMHYQLLRPKCIVAYDRECFVHSAGNVRVTLDQNIMGSNNVHSFFISCRQMTATLKYRKDGIRRCRLSIFMILLKQSFCIL